VNDLEHIDRLTIIPHELLPWLLAAGAAVVVWMTVTGVRDLVTGRPSREAPAFTCLAVGGGLIWLVTIKGGKGIEDGLVAALIGMIAVVVLWGLFSPKKSRPE